MNVYLLHNTHATNTTHNCTVANEHDSNHQGCGTGVPIVWILAQGWSHRVLIFAIPEFEPCHKKRTAFGFLCICCSATGLDIY